jgi:hypothetical protein
VPPIGWHRADRPRGRPDGFEWLAFSTRGGQPGQRLARRKLWRTRLAGGPAPEGRSVDFAGPPLATPLDSEGSREPAKPAGAERPQRVLPQRPPLGSRPYGSAVMTQMPDAVLKWSRSVASVPPAAKERAPRGRNEVLRLHAPQTGVPRGQLPYGIARRGAFQGPFGLISKDGPSVRATARPRDFWAWKDMTSSRRARGLWTTSG